MGKETRYFLDQLRIKYKVYIGVITQYQWYKNSDDKWILIARNTLYEGNVKNVIDTFSGGKLALMLKVKKIYEDVRDGKISF